MAKTAYLGIKDMNCVFELSYGRANIIRPICWLALTSLRGSPGALRASSGEISTDCEKS